MFLQERPPKQRAGFTSKVPDNIRKELAALSKKPEEEIDFSDIPATSEEDWADATQGQFYRPVKKQLTIKLDADVLDWLKSKGKGYQSKLNALLRDAMLKDYSNKNGRPNDSTKL